MDKRQRTVLIAILGLFSTTTAWAADENGPRLTLKTAIHVHSTASTGMLSLESLAQRAEQQGLDALILSENFSLRYEYGLRPLEGILKYEVKFPSLLEYGIERFLLDVRAVQQRHPGLIIVPGVEVAPHYYWTGSLAGHDLRMHNAQRNLLVIGLNKIEDYEGLPARGNPQSFAWDEHSVINGLPIVLGMPALWFWLPRKRATAESQNPDSPLRRTVAAAALLACAGLAFHAWPLSSPAFSSYDAQAGYQPYQALIDAATQRGGQVFWSMTEARDFSEHAFGPLGTVTVTTEPHPDSLILTHGYTGFGGLYQDTRRVTAPNGVWDQVLTASAAERRTPPTLIGEVAFHGLSDRAKDLDRVYTVVAAKDRTAAGVLEALQSGHAYAVARGDQNILLQLDEFQVVSGDRQRVAGMGETLHGRHSGPPLIRVAVSAADRQPHPARIRLIRSGQVIGQIEGDTPLSYELTDREAPAGERLYYRVEVIGKSGELLTNPIYLAAVTRDVG